ncbi:MAG: sugar ABC transporter substrate-binding protein, partial [Phycisphaerae bacterium]|nr:sugar ABC transporter substrate-binding protein [Phycisphaerae bacterium]
SIASATRRLPDVLEIDGPLVGPWAAEGLLRPLDAYVTSELRADFLPSILTQGTFNEKLYSLGAFDSALVVYFNRDLMEKAGLHPPESVADAWNWETFVEALRRVRPHATVPLSLHMDEQGTEWFTYAFSPLIWSNGGALIDTARKRVVGVLDGAGNVEAISRWQALFSEGLAEATTTNPNPFAAGLAAFDWTGHWMLPSFEAADIRFGAMPLPRMGEVSAAASGSWCWGLSRECRHPDDAWKVVAWLVDAEHGVEPIVRANGAVPARRSAFALFPEYEQMPRRLFREQLETAAHPRPRTAVYPSLSVEFARALRDVAIGNDVQKTLTRAAQSVQRALDRT